jgi:hypothetical protein
VPQREAASAAVRLTAQLTAAIFPVRKTGHVVNNSPVHHEYFPATALIFVRKAVTFTTNTMEIRC